jgi:hypothetical protein
MPSLIRAPKDFWPGLVFLFFGLASVYISTDYAMGSAGRMGPAYFPTILGWTLVLIGGGCVLRSLLRADSALGRFAVKELALVLSATVLFGVLVRGAGIAIAVVVVVILSGYASTKFKILPHLALAVGLALFSALVFVVGLGLPMPILGPWFRS